MAVRPVRIYGDPVLRQKAVPVESFDETLAKLVADMLETMHAYNGVGLAANQVGVLQRVLVIGVPDDQGVMLEVALVNPVLSQRSGAVVGEEGCLSIPGVFEDVKRGESVRVQARDVAGDPLDFVAHDYVARVVQHEVDHLDGVLFVDRLSLLKRQFLRRTLDALARGELPQGHRPPKAAEGTI